MPPQASGSIFISYRREDSAGYAGRLCEHLAREFGDRRVFMDVEDIAPGQDFAEVIDHTVSGCQVVLALVGPHWLSLLGARPEGGDFVRHEVGAAMARGVTVIPVLVGGASMPQARDLPAPLAPLSRRQAVELRDSRFEDDLKVLVAALHQQLSGPSVPRRLVRGVLAASLVAVVGIGAYWFTSARPVPRLGGSQTAAGQPSVVPPASVKLDGVWIAEMRKTGQTAYRVRLEFAPSTGTSVIGSVSYPTGDGAIRDGVLNGTRITFSTKHVPSSASEPATIRWEGEVVNGELQLVSADDNGVARGVARRTTP
jgi:hypothetical protein